MLSLLLDIELVTTSTRTDTDTVLFQHSRNTGAVCYCKSYRKRPLQEVTNIFNEYRARPVSDRTVQRKLYETKYHKCNECVVKKKHQNSRLKC